MRNSNTKNIAIALLAVAAFGLAILAAYKNNERNRYRSDLEDLRLTSSNRETAFQNEKKQLADTINSLRSQVEQLALVKQMEERRVQDSIAQAENQQDALNRYILTLSRIQKFGDTYMRGVSPSSYQDLEVLIDTANLVYNYYLKTLSVPFRVRWYAYMHNAFRDDSKSLHEYSGKYTLGAGYDEYIETIDQNYALQEGINTNKKFQKTLNDMGNVALLLDKINQIDQALKNR